MSLSIQYTLLVTLQSFIHSIDTNAVNDDHVMGTIFSTSMPFWLENGCLIKFYRCNLFHASYFTLCQSDLCIFFLQTGQISMYTQLPRYLSSLLVGCLVFKWCWIELVVLWSICSVVCIECLIIWVGFLTRKLKESRFGFWFTFLLFSCFFTVLYFSMKFVKLQQLKNFFA